MMIASEVCDGAVCFVPLREIRANVIMPSFLGLEQSFRMSLAQRRHGVAMMKVREVWRWATEVHGWVVDAFGPRFLARFGPVATARDFPAGLQHSLRQSLADAAYMSHEQQSRTRISCQLQSALSMMTLMRPCMRDLVIAFTLQPLSPVRGFEGGACTLSGAGSRFRRPFHNFHMAIESTFTLFPCYIHLACACSEASES
jgi:hypothetical protein